MLEDDQMISELRNQGACFIDLETATLFAVASKLGLKAGALHIVTDNPTRKAIDASYHHEASFDEQIDTALAALRGVRRD